ncbi:MAG: hypothetical protein AB1582_10655 [Pseudomonadota bacterium]
MGAGHADSAAASAGTAAGRYKTRLIGALALTTTFMALEVTMKSFGLAHVTIQVEDQGLRRAEGELRF